jgi:hypothetical protein
LDDIVSKLLFVNELIFVIYLICKIFFNIGGEGGGGGEMMVVVVVR